MTIKEEKPITMAEVMSLTRDSERGAEIKVFIKKFTQMTSEKAIEMKEELRKLDIIKLKEIHMVKIIDFLPTEATELNKIINDVSLDQEETNKILDVVKKY